MAKATPYDPANRSITNTEYMVAATRDRWFPAAYEQPNTNKYDYNAVINPTKGEAVVA